MLALDPSAGHLLTVAIGAGVCYLLLSWVNWKPARLLQLHLTAKTGGCGAHLCRAAIDPFDPRPREGCDGSQRSATHYRTMLL